MHSNLRFYHAIMVAFVVVLVCSNIIGTAKVAQVGGFEFTACLLFFPVTYLFGDILTEVYGYAHSRRVVWAGLAATAFASLMASVVVALPSSPRWSGQDAIQSVFGQSYRIAAASLVAYAAGEFVNSYVLARLKVATGGRHLWTRTIGSTVAGEFVDTVVFYPVAFIGVLDGGLLASIMLANYAMKVAWECVMTPFTYAAVKWLKREEGVDHFDVDTDFTPFKL